MNSTNKDFEGELPQIWEAFVTRFFDKPKYIPCLELTLQERGYHQPLPILDVSGGFGFPALDLLERGYPVVYNDGSPAMFSYFDYLRKQKNLGMFGMPELFPTSWKEMVKAHPPKFYGALLCRGNSLPYVVSWGKENPNLSQAQNEIATILRGFRRLLVKGGVFFVDKHRDIDVEKSEKEEMEDLGEYIDRFSGIQYELTSKLVNDPTTRKRLWTIDRTNKQTQEVEQFHSQAYYFTDDELVNMLETAGFHDIKQHQLAGDYYHSFTALS